MDLQALCEVVRTAEAVTLDAGPCNGLNLKQMVDAVPEAPNSVIRARSHSASVARAYLKLHKAQGELAAALRQCPPDRHSDSSGQKPRNSKMNLARIPATQTLEIVPYTDLKNSLPPVSSSPVPGVQEPVYGPERPSWRVWLQASRDIGYKWGLWAIGTLVTLCLPRLVTQLIGLCLKICVKQSVLAATTVASQAVEEIGRAGQYIVIAFEEALDLPPAISSTGAVVVPAAPAQAAMHATQSLLRDIAGSGDSNSSLLASAILNQLPQTAAAPQVQGWRIPGWLFVIAGSVVTRYLGS